MMKCQHVTFMSFYEKIKNFKTFQQDKPIPAPHDGRTYATHACLTYCTPGAPHCLQLTAAPHFSAVALDLPRFSPLPFCPPLHSCVFRIGWMRILYMSSDK